MAGIDRRDLQVIETLRENSSLLAFLTMRQDDPATESTSALSQAISAESWPTKSPSRKQ